MATTRARLGRGDKVALGILAFYMLIGLTLELYWVVFNNSMLPRVPTSILAKGMALYWNTDHSYRDPGMHGFKAFALAVESLNVFVWQPAGAWLMYAIVKDKPYRHGLQLIIACCVGYGTILYYWVHHLSSYMMMAWHTPGNYAMLYGVNLPWLAGTVYLSAQSVMAVMRLSSRRAVEPMRA